MIHDAGFVSWGDHFMKSQIAIGKYQTTLLVAWTVIITIAGVVSIYAVQRDSIEDALVEARAWYDAESAYQTWIARVGGIYVPVDVVQPNPYVKVSNRDVLTSTGKRLTLINSSYLNRLVLDVARNTATPVIKNSRVSRRFIGMMCQMHSRKRHCWPSKRATNGCTRRPRSTIVLICEQYGRFLWNGPASPVTSRRAIMKAISAEE